MLKILDRYLVQEIIPPFVMGVFGAFVMIVPVLLFSLADLVIKAGAPLGVISRIFFYNLPTIFVTSFPIAMLFGTLLAIGRMTKDFEIIALRSAGISLTRIMVPILVIAFFVSGLAFVINEGVVPAANSQINIAIKELVKGLTKPPMKANVFFEGSTNRYFYVKDIDKAGLMRDVFIFDKTKEGLPSVIKADRAQWVGDVYRLEDGHNYKYDNDGYVTYEIAFKVMDIHITLNTSNVLPEGLNISELTTKQMNDKLKELKQTGGRTNELEMQFHKRFSLPLASFCAALIAAPLGLIFSRMGGYVGVAFSVTLLFFYIVTMQITEALGKHGQIPAPLASWSANLVFLVVGTFLTLRMDRS